MARQTAQRRVGVAVGYPAGFEDEIVRGAIDYAEQVGNWSFHGQGHRPFKPFDQIDLSAVDGVIGLLNPAMAEAVAAAGVAAVNCSTRDEDLPLPRVGNDDQAIGRMGAEYLLTKGFGVYGFITQSDLWYGRRRLGGFRQVIEDDAGRSCQVLDLDAPPQADQAAAIGDWVGRAAGPIAVMAVNDSVGRLVINAAAERGLRVPEEIAVLGVDNDRWAAAMSAAPLSSVAIDARRIGYRAAKTLDGLMAGEAPPPPQWIAPTGVVTRRSTDIVMQEDPVVVEALRLMRDHCHEGLKVDDVLDALGVSRRSLEMRLKKATGQTPQTAIFAAQIDRAKHLLVNSGDTLGEIARACGFRRQERFSRVFKRLTGQTPGAFRANLTGGDRNRAGLCGGGIAVEPRCDSPRTANPGSQRPAG